MTQTFTQWRFRHPFMERSEFGEDDENEEMADMALTLTELRMNKLSYAIRSKPGWQTKYKDPTIRAKWKEEALAQEVLGGWATHAEIEYVLEELAEYETMVDKNTGVEPGCHARIWQSDVLIPEELRKNLLTGIAILENVPDEQKDWHPRSDDQVLDLVHPSLYCLVYGRTLAYPPLSECSAGSRTTGDLAVILGPQDSAVSNIEDFAISDKFAWIPTDFTIALHGESSRPLGYINNLHPSHTKLYDSLGQVVARFSHLFDRVLTDLHPANEMVRRVHGTYDYEGCPDQEEGEDDDAYYTRCEEWEEDKPIEQPTVSGEGYRSNAGVLSKREVKYSIKGRDCQVIIKLANIHLTPDKPNYPGGSWHVEGMGNERIVATAIYYYSSENVTESQLAFRTAVSFNLNWYQQSDARGVKRTFGLRGGTELNQKIGSITTSEGRCVAFPNIYQHRVAPFELSDKSKPGHRKIIAVFLVDPTSGQCAEDGTQPIQHKIPSTTVIPPQQADWLRGALDAENIPPNSHFHKMPLELIDAIANELQTHEYTTQEGSKALQLGSIMTRTEAEQYRLDLMDERTVFVRTHDDKFFEIDFNMCEH